MVDLTFDKADSAGELELSCHVPAHDEAGMHTSIVVES